MYTVECGSTHTACLVTMAWVSDDLIKNCMACKNKFSLVNRKVCKDMNILLLYDETFKNAMSIDLP